ncbi:MAG: hypothetical protein F4230_11985 [Holophagales bacterium]|nr:hypothetical protein [Holophagales bacterium]
MTKRTPIANGAFSIQDFWIPLLDHAKPIHRQLAKGWTCIDKGLPAFQEAPITLHAGAEAVDTAPVILVSAPGAVGKTTLARQISWATGSVYIDLATAGPVGEHTLSGGLFQSDLMEGWSQGTVALLIDGLDEARLKVNSESFDAFLRDVVRLSEMTPLPTILFGRTDAVDHAWLLLADKYQAPILKISYYDEESASKFVRARVQSKSGIPQHLPVQLEAAEFLLSRLRAQTEDDGDRFSGYAPVLLAVADRVLKEDNPSTLVSRVQDNHEPVTLQSVVDAILVRDRDKLRSIDFEDRNLLEVLYSPTEQMDRLAARVYNLPVPEQTVRMSHSDAKRYEEALESWFPDHPFLAVPRSSVFDAAIAADALSRPAFAAAALSKELRRGAAANPFLSVFYPGKGETTFPSEHVGVVYASVRSRLKLTEAATLSVIGGAERDGDSFPGDSSAEVEISLFGEKQDDVATGAIDGAGVLVLGAHVADAHIYLPDGTVELGSGSEATVAGPVSIECSALSIDAQNIVVESARGDQESSVFLQAEEGVGHCPSNLTVREGVSLAVCWPGAEIYPWTRFAKGLPEIDDVAISEALRRFRMFMSVFRGGKGRGLSRSRSKIESGRMTKGAGEVVLEALLREGILSRDDKSYFLSTDVLGEKLGVNWVDCQQYKFGPRVLDFFRQVLRR